MKEDSAGDKALKQFADLMIQKSRRLSMTGKSLGSLRKVEGAYPRTSKAEYIMG